MEDNKHVPPEDADHELEARILTAVKKIIPILRTAKNTTKVLRRLSSVGADTLVAALEAGTSWFHLKKFKPITLFLSSPSFPTGNQPSASKWLSV